jgi:hypothetical protein
MTYPQPRTTAQIAAGASQFRFLTQVGAINVGAGMQSAGAGEIYEIDSPFSAVAYGPEMDFGSVQLTYLDTSVPVTNQSMVRLSPQGGFPGALTPRFDTSYPLSPGRKGRMLLSLIDIWNGTYRPLGFSGGGGDEIFFVKPTIDVLGWQTPPPTLPSRRSDKTFLFQSYAKTAANNYWIIVPYYARRYGFVSFYNKSGGPINFEMRGVNLSTVNTDVGQGTVALHQETQLVTSVAIADGAKETRIVSAGSDGEFDLLAIALGFNGAIANCPLKVIVSDSCCDHGGGILA